MTSLRGKHDPAKQRADDRCAEQRRAPEDEFTEAADLLVEQQAKRKPSLPVGRGR